MFYTQYDVLPIDNKSCKSELDLGPPYIVLCISIFYECLEQLPRAEGEVSFD